MYMVSVKHAIGFMNIYILQVSYKQKYESHIKKLEDANREKDFTIQQLQATINSLMVHTHTNTYIHICAHVII